MATLSRGVGPLRELRLHRAAGLPRLEHGPLLGTTAQWWLSHSVALQGTALGGVGFGAAGTIHGSGERDYHYGTTPQGLLALRLIFGDMAMLDVTAREYYVSGVGSTEIGDRRTSSAGRRRSPCACMAAMPSGSSTSRRNGTRTMPTYPTGTRRWKPSIAYTFLGDTGFGAVEWRE